MQEPGVGRRRVKSAVSQMKETADSSIDLAIGSSDTVEGSGVVAGML